MRIVGSAPFLAISGYWLTSYCCESWLYMRNIVTQSL